MEKNSNNSIDEILSVGKSLAGIICDAVNGKDSAFDSTLDYEKLYLLAEKHKVTAVAGYALKNTAGIPDKIKHAFDRQIFITAARYEAQLAEAKELSALFTSCEIKHCILKGTKVAAYYDVPDMRFMLDADIYVDKEKFDNAKAIMLSRGYTVQAEDDKDTGFEKKPFLFVEIHRELKYDYDIGCEYFRDAYKNLVESENGGLELKMTDEDFYVYILSHTAHHFSVAGTGLRSVLDHYYLVKKLLPLCDKDLIEKKLCESGLTEFNERLTRLSECVFSGKATDELTEAMLEYILLSGIYGTETNSYINGVLRRGLSSDKKTYFFSRLFPGVAFMSVNYPIVKKLPVLLPLFWMIRLFKAIFFSSKAKGEAKALGSATEEDRLLREEFFTRMGI